MSSCGIFLVVYWYVYLFFVWNSFKCVLYRGLGEDECESYDSYLIVLVGIRMNK